MQSRENIPHRLYFWQNKSLNILIPYLTDYAGGNYQVENNIDVVKSGHLAHLSDNFTIKTYIYIILVL